MKARYSGFCSHCNQQINVGSEILKDNPTQSWIHVGCFNLKKNKKLKQKIIGKPKKCGYCGKPINLDDDFHQNCLKEIAKPKEKIVEYKTTSKKHFPDFKCEYCKKNKKGTFRGADLRPSGKKFKEICKDCSKKINQTHIEPKNLHNRFDGK